MDRQGYQLICELEMVLDVFEIELPTIHVS